MVAPPLPGNRVSTLELVSSKLYERSVVQDGSDIKFDREPKKHGCNAGRVQTLDTIFLKSKTNEPNQSLAVTLSSIGYSLARLSDDPNLRQRAVEFLRQQAAFGAASATPKAI